MSDSIIELLDKLPSDNLTVKTLNALSYVVPGKWENVVGCDKTISVITGVNDANTVMQIRNRMIELYNDKDNGYHKAVRFYRIVDNADKALGAAAMANKIGEKIGFLSFLNKLTPKADTTQSIDLCLKIVAELIAYSKLNGIKLSPTDFVSEVRQNYKGAALMRMVALVCVDGLIPLGPDFLQKAQDTINNKGERTFENNPVFGAIQDSIPSDDKINFIASTFNSVSGWMDNLVSSTGLTPQSVFNKMGGFIEFSDDKLDFVAAFLDQSTNYFEHTGIQTVARKLILRAAEDV